MLNRSLVVVMCLGAVLVSATGSARATEVGPATICDQLGEGIRGVVSDWSGQLDLSRIAAKAPQLQLHSPEARPLGSSGTVYLDARRFFTAAEIAEIERSELLADGNADMRLIGSAPMYLVIEHVGGALATKWVQYFERTAGGLEDLGQPPHLASSISYAE